MTEGPGKETGPDVLVDCTQPQLLPEAWRYVTAIKILIPCSFHCARCQTCRDKNEVDCWLVHSVRVLWSATRYAILNSQLRIQAHGRGPTTVSLRSVEAQKGQTSREVNLGMGIRNIKKCNCRKVSWHLYSVGAWLSSGIWAHVRLPSFYSFVFNALFWYTGPVAWTKIAPWSSRWFEESCSDLAHSDLAHFDLACSDLGNFFVKILTFFTQYSQLGNSFCTHPNGTNLTK